MTEIWSPVPDRFAARRENRALAGGLDEDTAPLVGELARVAGYDHAFLVAWQGRTTQVQTVVWPMILLTEPSH